MAAQESLRPGKLFHRRGVLIAVAIFFLVSAANLVYAQNNTSGSGGAAGLDFLDLLVNELTAILASILGLGITALAAWLRNRGIPITTEQEAMFKEIVTRRFQKLAKDSWSEMRAHPEKLDEYWKELGKGKVPVEFQKKLKQEGYEFATELKKNREFKDFAKKMSEEGMKRLLKDLRNELKLDYQKRMIDVIPKLASTAVDSAFDPEVRDVDSWSRKALKDLRPLLLSTEAIDTEQNLMIIIRAEINRRLQERLQH